MTPPLRQAIGFGAAIAAGSTAGVLTAYGQGWLGDDVNSLANSAGPWALVAFVVAWFADRPLWGALWSTATLLMCEVGYAVATEVRGGSNSPTTVQFWLVAGILAGPPLGVAAVWARRSPLWWQAGSGAAVIPGVLIGEGVYGLTKVADTTNPAYWTVEIALGVAALVGAIVWLLRRRIAPTAVVACTGMAGLAALVVYGAGVAV